MAVEAKRGRREKKRYGVMDFTKWKQNVMEMLIKDDQLALLLHYNTPDCLSKPLLTDNQKEELVNNSIYGYRFVPDVAEEQKSYISLGLSNFVPQEGFRQFSDDYVQGFIYFYILVDTAIMETETGYRNDLILARIYDIFQEQKGIIGMGELRMEACSELWQHNNKFGGYTLGFRVVAMK